MRQIAMKFRTWGGKRRKAGRKQTKARKSEPHRRRALIDAQKPVHVTLRVAPAIRRLRRMDAYAALRKAMLVVLERPDFRMVHVSIQANHVHLLVEAGSAEALARGMQAFQISAARKLNAEAGRTGTVFPDRYHAVVITSRRGARHALAYVLNNWRRHKEDRAGGVGHWILDKYSSAILFDGWAEGSPAWVVPDDYEPLPVCSPHSWLLTEGWKLYGLISVNEVPGKA